MAGLEIGLVLNNRQVGSDLYEMDFTAPNISRQCQPGQFLNVIVGSGLDPLLRRPLSLYDVDKESGTISLLYKVVGRGTALLTGLKPDDSIDLMGPLGRAFALPSAPRKNLLVGGGVGIAPLVYLARELMNAQSQVTVLYGAENSNQLAAVERLEQIGVQVMPITMDGSRGIKGLSSPKVVQGEVDLAEFEYIYTCGPEAMMASWWEYARINGIDGQVSLEEHMACGVGACLGCARKLKKDDESYAKVCKDGPVFDMEELDFGA